MDMLRWEKDKPKRSVDSDVRLSAEDIEIRSIDAIISNPCRYKN